MVNSVNWRYQTQLTWLMPCRSTVRRPLDSIQLCTFPAVLETRCPHFLLQIHFSRVPASPSSSPQLCAVHCSGSGSYGSIQMCMLIYLYILCIIQRRKRYRYVTFGAVNTKHENRRLENTHKKTFNWIRTGRLIHGRRRWRFPVANMNWSRFYKQDIKAAFLSRQQQTYNYYRKP